MESSAHSTSQHIATGKYHMIHVTWFAFCLVFASSPSSIRQTTWKARKMLSARPKLLERRSWSVCSFISNLSFDLEVESIALIPTCVVFSSLSDKKPKPIL